MQNVQFDDARRWANLLDKLDTAELTDEFIARVTGIPIYAAAPLPLSEIRRTGRASFDALINAMKEVDDAPDFLRARKAIAMDVGVSRARAGVPIEALMTAIRLDFSIIWTAITSIAGPQDALLMVEHTARVWEVVDGYAGETQQAYVAELARIQAEAASMRQGYLATLFSEKDLAEETLERISAELGQLPQTEYVVVAAMGDQVQPLRLALATERASAGVYTHSLADALIVFYPHDSRSGSECQRLGARLEGINCGMVMGPRTLSAIPRASLVARSLAQLLETGEQGAMTWARGWARMARMELAEAGAPGLEEVERALARCSSTERRRLAESTRAYLRTGSISQAAEESFCHRNTLMNRLKRFAELTGVDPTVPEQAAQLVVGWS